MLTRRQLVIGAAAAAPFVIAGCSSTASPSSSTGTVDIKYWLWQDDATDPTWQNLATEFNASQNKGKVTLEVIPLDQYQDKLVTAAANNTGPDCARSKEWWLGQFAPKGMVADMSAQVNAWSGKADVINALWATGKIPGKDSVYMMPHQYTTLYMYYRKDLFAAAGLQPPKSQSDVIAAAKKLTDGSKQYG
ncbi:MAG: extracellular solute-binding protein, partial [Actinobacteria bacterium]|nr:extracellular solute-binding protein [Actinomycetota bacterium]